MNCPPNERLRALLEEALSGPDTATIAGHVDHCTRCQDVLEELSGSMEPLSIQVPPSLRAEEANFLQRLKETPPSFADYALLSRGGKGSQGASADVVLPMVPGYEVLGILGRGGMGIVYQAVQRNLNRMVALKMILHGPHARSHDLARFRREVEAVAQLRHPHIVQIYDVGEVDGYPYCALEYIEGGSLADRLRGDPQPLHLAARLIETLARAIHHAHLAGIVHRDLKPANILLARLPHDGSHVRSMRVEDPARASGGGVSLAVFPKISDFGLAKRLDDSQAPTQTGEILGTPSYMAPEQAGGPERQIGPGVDVYALGAILYELLTGRPPFKGATALDTVIQVVHEEPIRPSILRPGLPPDLETICLACLNKEPGRRYVSALALAEDLRRYLHGKPILARPVGPLERVWKWMRRKPMFAALLVGMLLSLVAGFSGISWQWREAALARDTALAEKREKELEKQEAELARALAVEAQLNESEQRVQARSALYFSRIAQSELAWRVNDYLGARQALAKCRPNSDQEDRRNWEWYYLEGLYHTYLFSFRHARPGADGWVAYSADGRRIFSIVGGDPGDDASSRAECRVWDAATGDLKYSRVVPRAMDRLALDPREPRMVLGGSEGTILICDARDGREIHRIAAHDSAVSALAFHPEGGMFVSAGWDGRVKLWDGRTGKLRREYPSHASRVQSVAVHPDGRRLVSVCWDGKIRIWDLKRDEALLEWQGHKGAVFSVSFSPDGRKVATASRTGTLKIWDVETARGLQSLTGGAGAILSIAWSPDGRFLGYGGGDATVRIWDVEAGEERIVLRGHTAPVESVAFSPDGRRLVSSTPPDGTVKVWDVTRHPEQAVLARTEADAEALQFDRSGKRLISVTVGGRIQHWDASTGVMQYERKVALCSRMVSPAVVAALDAGAERLAGRCEDDARRVRIWDTRTGKELVRQLEHRSEVRAVCFSVDGRLLATAADEGVTGTGKPSAHEIAVWDVETGQRRAMWRGVGRVFSVAFDAEGERLAWGKEGGVIGLVEVDSGGKPAEYARHKGSVIALAFSRDGETLASAGLEDRLVCLWRVAGGSGEMLQPRHALTAPAQVCDLAFSPDDQRLVAASRDVIKSWDVAAGQEVLTLRGASQRHWDAPFNPRVAFSPDGSLLAASNWNETISVWEAEVVEDGAAASRLQRRRQAVEERASAWHLEQAELCLDQKNLTAARFHLERVSRERLSAALEQRRQGVMRRLEPTKRDR